jgi:hypothetical protein
LVSRIERGRLDQVSLRVLRRAASVLELTLDLRARWRGSELDRLLNADHSRLADEIVAFLREQSGWEVIPEVSYSIYGELGVVDLVAWHAESRSLLVVEIKTLIVEVNDLVGKVDAKRRLGPQIVSDRGWRPARVAAWVIVADSRTNERRIRAHRDLLRAAFPHNGHDARAWLASPLGSLAALFPVEVKRHSAERNGISASAGAVAAPVQCHSGCHLTMGAGGAGRQARRSRIF